MKFSKYKIIFIFIGVFIIFSFNFYQKEIKNLFYFISSPIQKSLWNFGKNISNFFTGILEQKGLKKENEELRLKINDLMAQIVALKELKEENKALREALDIGLKKEFKLVFCQVIGKDISQDSILINVGEEEGIKEDLPVITQQKTLVGKVSDVYKNFSRVMLISNKDSSFDGKVSEKDIFGLVKGKGNLKISFEFIPKEKNIEVGDAIITSALGGKFPQGILVGSIQEIEKSDIEPFQKAEIRSAFNIKDLNFLFVIKKW